MSIVLTLTNYAAYYFNVCQILNRKPYGFSVDWWSLGVLMYLMMLFEVCRNISFETTC